MEIKIPPLWEDDEHLNDGLIEVLAQLGTQLSISYSHIMASSAVPWQTELKKKLEKVGSLL